MSRRRLRLLERRRDGTRLDDNLSYESGGLRERGLPNETHTTLNGGSLGSWVDEERSKLRVDM